MALTEQVKMADPELVALKLKLVEWEKRQSQKAFDKYFPEKDTVDRDGEVIHARASYPKHLEFFSAGKKYRERCFLAANRIGKTICGAYEASCHLTGMYPTWWPGRRFTKPVKGWVCGKTNESTRDIVQETLFGPVAYEGANRSFAGTGLIPGRLVGKPTWKAGVQGLADMVMVKHITGGWSVCGVKSYAQGRGAFEGTAQHFIWDDEEPPIDIYGEQLIRLTTTKGIIYITFTPLDGITETVLQFLPADMRPDGFGGGE
jgi:phage terminase large subunit-like protein